MIVVKRECDINIIKNILATEKFGGTTAITLNY